MLKILDPARNLCVVTISAGYAYDAIEVVLATGDGAQLPDTTTEGAFNLSWYNATDYPYFGFNASGTKDPYFEFIRVNARTGDLLSISRGQEGTAPQNHNIVGKTYKMVLPFSRITYDQIRNTTYIDVREKGAVLDGVTDDTAAFQAAINALGDEGGTVIWPWGKAKIDGDLTVKKYVRILGPSRLDINTNAEMMTPSALILNTTKSIYLEQGAGLEKCFIRPKGITFPVADPSGYAGIAVTGAGTGPFLQDCLIVGFNKLFYSDGRDRIHINNLRGDGVNGIEILNVNDIPRLDNIHLWPWGTYTGGAGPDHQRTGIGFKISGTTYGDWSKLTNNFCHGYKYGFWLTGLQGAALIGCGAEPDGVQADSIGFRISGETSVMTLTDCKAGGFALAGLWIESTVVSTGDFIEVNNFHTWLNTNYGIVLACTSNVKIGGGYIDGISGLGYGIYINNASPIVRIDGVRFRNITTRPIEVTMSNPNVFIGGNNDFGNFAGNPVGGTRPMVQVASAATITLPNNGDFFEITGTADISTINYGWRDRKIRLKFTGNAATNGLVDGGGNLKLSGNFVYTVDDIVDLVHDGTDWLQVGESIN